MSKLGKKPILLPKESTVKVDSGSLFSFWTKRNSKINF